MPSAFRSGPLSLLATCLCLASACMGETTTPAEWHGLGSADGALGGGLSGSITTVQTATVHGDALVVGGSMRLMGEQRLHAVARWDGASWGALGEGIDSEVYALSSAGGMLYAGGSAGVSRWDGAAWTPLGAAGALTGNVLSLASDGTLVYAGTTTGLHVWDGTAWSSMGITATAGSPSVSALCRHDGSLYVGGTFTHAGGIAAGNLARWNGTAWSAIGSANGEVRAIAAWNGQIIATGRFTSIGGTTARRIAAYPGSGSTWSALGAGLPADGLCLASDSEDLLVGCDSGTWSTDTAADGGSVRRWNGSTWTVLGTPDTAPLATYPRSTVCIAMFDSALHAGATDSGNVAGIIRRWNGTAWERITPRGYCDGAIDSIAIDGTTLLLSGPFTRTGPAASTGFAAWNPDNGWSALPGTRTPFVSAEMIARDGVRYLANGETLSRWNGGAWQAIGTVENRSGWAIDSDGSLFVVGTFTTAGGTAASGVARFDGASWSQIGGGLAGSPQAVAVADGMLYVGGSLTGAGGLPLSARLVRWDGSAWSTLPAGGPADTVWYLAADAGMVYAGTSTLLHAWNGTAWSSLATSAVRSLAAQDGIAYVLRERELMTWDGTTSTVLLGSASIDGMFASNGLAMGTSYLAVRGPFTHIHDKAMPRLAILALGGETGRPAAPIDIDPAPDRIGTFAAIGARVGIHPHAADPDHTPAILRLDDDAGGRFAIDGSGAVVVAGPLAPPGIYTITIRAADNVGDGGATDIAILVNEAPRTPIDSDPAANVVRTDAAIGTAVGITAFSEDPDGATITYALLDDAGGRFRIDPDDGRVLVHTALESSGSHSITAVASDGVLSASASFTITVQSAGGGSGSHAGGGGGGGCGAGGTAGLIILCSVVGLRLRHRIA